MDDDAFQTDDIDISTHEILLAAAHHDKAKLLSLLHEDAGLVKAQDNDTGYTPLHSAIASLAPVDDVNGSSETSENGDNGQSESQMERAIETVKLLFENGAIWNDLDANQETPGCLAWRLKLLPLYEIIVDAGVRAELLLNRLDDFELLGDDDESDDDDMEIGSGDLDAEKDDHSQTPDVEGNHSTVDSGHNLEATEETTQEADRAAAITSAAIAVQDLSNPTYLSARLSFSEGKLLDEASNGVMMAWESTIMSRTADVLLPRPGLRVLNIGHGMGIIDSYFSAHEPSQHHIIEAHPDVLQQMKAENGWLSQQHHAHSDRITVHEGRWQDILPKLVEEGAQYDAIYFDTFAEDYKAFKTFFDEYVVALLDGAGRMSFFHGLGADRQVCYDVYTKVVEMDLFDAGLEVEWQKVDVPDLDRTGEWDGVSRKYWALEEYRLPVCSFVG